MSSEIDEHIGRRLRSRRKMLGLTQLELGVAVGVRFQQIQKYECAASTLSVRRLYLLARELDVQITYFFDGFEQTARAAA